MTVDHGEGPPMKKRKLPALDDSFDAPKRPSDSPALHQGRKRAAPHVRGQWASHVYLELMPSGGLSKALREAYKLAEESATGASIHSLLAPSSPDDAETSDPRNTRKLQQDTKNTTLHVSLSRPLMLLTNQRDDLQKAVSRVASQTRAFPARYASFGVLENDEKTRRFLGAEIAQGYQELTAVVEKLDKQLVALRLPAYYDEPRFHTSIAWTTATSAQRDNNLLPFAEELLGSLETTIGPLLRKEGEVWVDELCVKVGKDVTRYRLAG